MLTSSLSRQSPYTVAYTSIPLYVIHTTYVYIYIVHTFNVLTKKVDTLLLAKNRMHPHMFEHFWKIINKIYLRELLCCELRWRSLAHAVHFIIWVYFQCAWQRAARVCALCWCGGMQKSRFYVPICILNYILYSIYLLSSTFTKIYSHMNVYMLCIPKYLYREIQYWSAYIHIYWECWFGVVGRLVRVVVRIVYFL